MTRGAILDIAADIRRASPTFGRHAAVVLSADNRHEDNPEVQYKVTDFYSLRHERGVAWDDLLLAIAWPVAAAGTTVAERDRIFPHLGVQPDLFEYDP